MAGLMVKNCAFEGPCGLDTWPLSRQFHGSNLIGRKRWCAFPQERGVTCFYEALDVKVHAPADIGSTGISPRAFIAGLGLANDIRSGTLSSNPSAQDWGELDWGERSRPRLQQSVLTDSGEPLASSHV
jgi:hypothetical protein